jgi:hypothetical protein
MDALRGGAGILQIDILSRDLDIVQSGLDAGVTHQLHKRGQADAGAHHVGGERVPEPVRVGKLDAGSAAMVTKQGA